MPVITRISERNRSPRRRNIYVDGKFAFACNVAVAARFGLREGLEIAAEQVERIRGDEVRQECFDAAIHILERRLHSQAELRQKLISKEYGESLIDTVLDELIRLDYINDDRFARARALSDAEHKQHGRRRAMLQLRRSGVGSETAARAVNDVYQDHNSTAVARTLAMKQAPRLRRLDPVVARRRLVGMLQRRGFDYDAIRPIIDEALGPDRPDEEAM